MSYTVTDDDLKADAASEIEDARTHIMNAMRILDSSPRLTRLHLEVGAIALAIDDLRGNLTGEPFYSIFEGPGGEHE